MTPLLWAAQKPVCSTKDHLDDRGVMCSNSCEPATASRLTDLESSYTPWLLSHGILSASTMRKTRRADPLCDGSCRTMTPLHRPLSSLELPETSALCLAHNDKHIFAGLPSGQIRVWQTNSLKVQAELEGHTRSVLSLLHVQEGNNSWLISASADSTVRIWDSRSLKPLWSIPPPHDGFGDALSVAYMHGRIVMGSQSCALLVSDKIHCLHGL